MLISLCWEHDHVAYNNVLHYARAPPTYSGPRHHDSCRCPGAKEVLGHEQPSCWLGCDHNDTWTILCIMHIMSQPLHINKIWESSGGQQPRCFLCWCMVHFLKMHNAIMSVIASQITSNSAPCSKANDRETPQLSITTGSPLWVENTVDSPHKGPVMSWHHHVYVSVGGRWLHHLRQPGPGSWSQHTDAVTTQPSRPEDHASHYHWGPHPTRQILHQTRRQTGIMTEAVRSSNIM